MAPPAKVSLLFPAADIKVRTSSSNDIIKGPPPLIFWFESTYNLPFCCSDRQSHPQSCCNHNSLLCSLQCILQAFLKTLNLYWPMTMAIHHERTYMYIHVMCCWIQLCLLVSISAKKEISKVQLQLSLHLAISKWFDQTCENTQLKIKAAAFFFGRVANKAKGMWKSATATFPKSSLNFFGRELPILRQKFDCNPKLTAAVGPQFSFQS